MGVFRACDKGHLGIIKYLWMYFYSDRTSSSNKNFFIPVDLDLYNTDERTGENTAMIAAKNGHFSVLK